MSVALKRVQCEECGRVDVGVNDRGQLYAVCDCPESERAVKVASKIPETWT